MEVECVCGWRGGASNIVVLSLVVRQITSSPSRSPRVAVRYDVTGIRLAIDDGRCACVMVSVLCFCKGRFVTKSEVACVRGNRHMCRCTLQQ